MKKSVRRHQDLIFLRDLAPRREAKGGAGKRVFGETVDLAARPAAEKKKKTHPGKPKR